MKRICSIFRGAAIVTAVLPLLASCHEVDPTPAPWPEEPEVKPKTDEQLAAKNYLRKEYMDVYYYWQADVKAHNAGVPVTGCDIYDYFDALLYKGDRWSWMCDKEYFVESESGVVTGTYGASLGQPIEYFDDYGVYVRYVYPDSPFAKQGVTRGWLLTHVGNMEVMERIIQGSFELAMSKSPQTFTFIDTEGESHTFTTEWATELNTRSSLETKIFTDKDFPGLKEPVGYFNYLSFKANFLGDIQTAMETFRAAGVRTLILDLRYNGGGDSRASQLLVNYLAPESAKGKVYVSRVHNAILASENESEKIGDEVEDPVTKKTVTGSSIGIEHLYIITGEGSASASEMVTNGLRPLMDVKMVGDTTYGKPNGMYVLMYPGSEKDYQRYNAGDYTNLEWVFLPICFYNMNGSGQSIPDNGFAPDFYWPDDLYHDFNVKEGSIKACLTHIATGSFPKLPANVANTTRATTDRRKAAISVDEKKPNYGLYTVYPAWKNK